MERFEIPLKLPSLNEYIEANRINRFKAAKMKRDTEEAIMIYMRQLPKFNNPVRIHFLWYEENRRRDVDNVAFGKKFIIDALVKMKKIDNDGQRYVKGVSDSFEIADKAKVIVTIMEDLS